MFLLTRFFCVSFSLLAAAQILPEVDPGNAYQRLRVALDNHDEQVVLSIIDTEQDSLQSTQEGVNLAVLAMVRYGELGLYNDLLSQEQEKDHASFCCYKVQKFGYLPNYTGIESAYIGAAKCQRDINFLKQIPLPASSAERLAIYHKAFDEVEKLVGVRSGYAEVLFYLGEHIEEMEKPKTKNQSYAI